MVEDFTAAVVTAMVVAIMAMVDSPAVEDTTLGVATDLPTGGHGYHGGHGYRDGYGRGYYPGYGYGGYSGYPLGYGFGVNLLGYGGYYPYGDDQNCPYWDPDDQVYDDYCD
ncbi:hypothetical protein NHF48_011315 [Sphingomonas sp. H160509]|uniref:hypothetical protein n=1 Tax=Sphingomonas sp. H160509 TaxID=2955313 RepID=UPI0020979319|nr:hypothetical protein [Sphingomonas sp. H160509]MDD1451426.1 hypothetical protein [Sphingomonas sp. H160509]